MQINDKLKVSTTEGKKTLIVLTPGFAESETDTACLPFMQSHVSALQRASPDTEIIIIAFQYPFFRGTYRWQNLEVIAFDGRGRARFNRLLVWIKVWKELTHLKRNKNIIGLFSVWCTECSLLAHYFGKLNRIKNFIWICGQDAKQTNKYVKLIRPMANELVAISNFLQREFEKNHGVKPEHFIPNGIDPAEFPTIEYERDIDLLGVGNLIPLKQYEIFVQVVNRLKESFPGLKTRICGKGPEKARLNSLIKDLLLQDHISLEGEQPHKDILHLMKRSKILIHPSNYEGLGVVCLEALYAGAHVISFTKPMDAEIPNWHHVKDTEEMIEKARTLLLDKSLKAIPVIPYDIDDIAKQIIWLYAD